jgi:hypothetical protein
MGQWPVASWTYLLGNAIQPLNGGVHPKSVRHLCANSAILGYTQLHLV